MHKSIILSSALFGSIYIFSTSIKLINDLSINYIHNFTYYNLLTFNGIICIYSLYSFNRLIADSRLN